MAMVRSAAAGGGAAELVGTQQAERRVLRLDRDMFDLQSTTSQRYMGVALLQYFGRDSIVKRLPDIRPLSR